MLRAIRRRSRHGRSHDGQALTEFALTAPLFFMLLFGIIVIGMAVFYQQQVTNAAREGARYASLNSATSRCPTVSNRAPDPALLPLPNSYSPVCDPPATRWPKMTAAARSKLFGLSSSGMQLTACWSGYWVKVGVVYTAHDNRATDPTTGAPNDFRECTVRVYGWCAGESADSTLHIVNPRSSEDPSCGGADKTVSIDCSKQFPLTTLTDDMASSFAASNGYNANQVTVVTCYAWNPPLAGFLLIPRTLNIMGVITESMEYQQ